VNDTKTELVEQIQLIRSWISSRGSILPNGVVSALIDVLDYAAAPNTAQEGARLVINHDDFSSKLTGFALQCSQCGSRQVTLDIDWAAYPSASWCKVDVICEQCHFDEEIIDI